MDGLGQVEAMDISIHVRITESTPRFLGTYSYVYVGRYQDEAVAVKVLKLVSRKSLHAMRRKMRRERELWAALSHPNIVQLYGYAENSDSFGLFGALVSPWEGVIAGVHYLHVYSPPIVHGNLKPGNILIDNELNPKICDFGLSRILLEEESTGFTTTSEHTGTERYLAYELVTSDDMCLPTTATDVFALGCIGLEFIWGKQPHAKRKNNVRGHIFQDIRNGIPPADRPHPLEYPFIPFWDLLQLCWCIDGADCPNTAFIIATYKNWHCLLNEGQTISTTQIPILSLRDNKRKINEPQESHDIHENESASSELQEHQSVVLLTENQPPLNENLWSWRFPQSLTRSTSQPQINVTRFDAISHPVLPSTPPRVPSNLMSSAEITGSNQNPLLPKAAGTPNYSQEMDQISVSEHPPHQLSSHSLVGLKTSSVSSRDYKEDPSYGIRAYCEATAESIWDFGFPSSLAPFQPDSQFEFRVDTQAPTIYGAVGQVVAGISESAYSFARFVTPLPLTRPQAKKSGPKTVRRYARYLLPGT